jgi:hypothetical protein
VLRWAGITETLPALGATFLVWLGFVATSSATNVVFGGGKWSLWWIQNGYHLVAALLSAAILTLL